MADVEIDQVFKDNTDLDLTVGDVVSIKSGLQSAACGEGGSFMVNDQWIMFVRTPFVGINSVDSQATRRLDLTTRPVERDISEETLCDLEGADLQTDVCSGNVLQPRVTDVAGLELACS